MNISKSSTEALVIDGSSTVTFYRNGNAVTVGQGVSGVMVTNWLFHQVHATTRIKRFLAAVPKLWAFCK